MSAALLIAPLFALAKARPGQLNYASSGSGSYLAVEYFSNMAGLKMNHVPYKSGAPAGTPREIIARLYSIQETIA